SLAEGSSPGRQRPRRRRGGTASERGSARGRRGAAAAPSRSARSALSPARSRYDRLAQRREPLLADPRNLPQLVDRAKAAVRLPVLDDALGQGRPDPVERLELLGGGRGEADRPRGRTGRASARTRPGGAGAA